jgi:hypothetical protein
MDWYQRTLVDTGRSATLWALIGFLVAFAITRAITRHIRNKPETPAGDEGGGVSDVYIGGVHVHHQVWGILLVLIAGLLEFRFSPASPWADVLAALFGVGAALALDEFALWFHLDDVYWSTEGRKSVDAVMIGGAVGAGLLVASSPIGGDLTEDMQQGLWAVAITVSLDLALALICILKGKIAVGLIGIVVPTVATFGAIRLAKPGSWWFQRRYGDAKQARSQARFGARYAARRDRIRDLIGGTPSDPQA